MGRFGTTGAGNSARAARLATRLGVDPALAFFDGLLIVGAYAAVMILRFDGSVPERWRSGFFSFLAVVVAAHLVANWGCGLYRQMWRHASASEAVRVVQAGIAASALILLVWYLLNPRPVPLSVAVLGAFVATMVMGALRFQSRLLSFHKRSAKPSGLRVVVVGAGEAGAAIVREMKRTANAGLLPVAILDDDRRKIGLSLLGVPVVGATADLVDVVARFDAHRVVLAVRNAGNALVTSVAAAAEQAEVPLQVLPGFGDVVKGRASLRDVRDLSIEDLIGRDEVHVDADAVREMVRGRRVLVTGGGGSIGSEIGRQVAACSPAELVLLDHDKTHLHDAAARIEEPVVLALADVRDEKRMVQVFARHRPHIVFHAAAHKHVPILESQASEAAETNVIGTERVAATALAFGVERLVFISTDKAVRPSSVMGASKRLGEQLVLSRAGDGRRFCAVRFGNVLASRGSVIPTFARQIAAGGPVTVTDERMTRYFMTIEEAVQLVLQAAVFCRGGEIFMLEMGRAVNIMELAKRMIRLSGLRPGVDIDVQVTGVRPGEKLEEELAAPEETKHATDHPAIVRLDPTLMPEHRLVLMLDELRDVAARKDDPEAAHRLLEHAGAQPMAHLELEIDLRALERDEFPSQPHRAGRDLV